MVLKLPRVPQLLKHGVEIRDDVQKPIDYPISKIMDYFSGVVLNSAVWNNYTNNSAQIIVGSGECNLSTGATASSYAVVYGKTLWNMDDISTLIFQSRVKVDAGDAANCLICQWGLGCDRFEYVGFHATTDTNVKCTSINDNEDTVEIDATIDVTVYHNYKIIVEKNIITWFIDDVLVAKIERGTLGYPNIFSLIYPSFQIVNSGAVDRDIRVTNARITIT